nr:hypothetical protein [Fusobacterium gastrosuis]
MMLSNVIQKISQLSKKEDFLIYEDNSLLKNVEIKNYETLTKKFDTFEELFFKFIEIYDNKEIRIKNKNLTYLNNLKLIKTDNYEYLGENINTINQRIKHISNLIDFKILLPTYDDLKNILKNNKKIEEFVYYNGSDLNINYSNDIYSRYLRKYYFGILDLVIQKEITSLKSFKNQSNEIEEVYNLTDLTKREEEIERLNIKYPENLKVFEIFLKYNFLPDGIPDETSYFDLVKNYKIYSKYIKDIYCDKNNNKIEIIFDENILYDELLNGAEELEGIELEYTIENSIIEKISVERNKKIYYFTNGDKEILSNNEKGIVKSEYNYQNGNLEEREYKNRKLQGKSILHFANGVTEERRYIEGVLNGEATFKRNGKIKKINYINGIREEVPTLKYYLSIDKERINIDEYEENRLLDPNIGHWDLKEEDKEDLREILGETVYKRDPRKDIKNGGIVGIDFGTKSTVVVFQNDSDLVLPMRISGEILNKDVRDTDYENPTVIEFRNIENFIKTYIEKKGRPDTKWEDLTVSHTAYKNLIDGSSEQFSSIISDLKQWTANKEEQIIIIDKTKTRYELLPYLSLDENNSKNIDPVEIYAYYIGSYINTMRNGVYLEYFLSFPVTYEKAIRNKILKSFEKGIRKSLPIEIQNDEKTMKKFKVRHGANEPAAFSVCALKEFEIEPSSEEEKVYYAVFDFGGGTTDFDFGTWKFADDELSYDYELEHFGSGGDQYLGGENILKELAYRVFSKNISKLRKDKIFFSRPVWCHETIGEETLVNNTREAKLNIKRLAEKLRPIWEENKEREVEDVITGIYLFNSQGESNTNIELEVDKDELRELIENKIEIGINKFFIAMEKAFADEEIEEIHVFLAGNSCRHAYVNEVFNRYKEEWSDKFNLNIYTPEQMEKLKEKRTKNEPSPTGKTGVAYGLLYSRIGGRIKITNRDEKENAGNEINFKYYVGTKRRGDIFKLVIGPTNQYEKFEVLAIVNSDVIDLYYTTNPEATTETFKIDETVKKYRINLEKEYVEGERIYIKSISPNKLSYAIVTNEDKFDKKDFLEVGEIILK